jgi:uncharacterized repeat protein (TIGR03803 family)
VLRNSHELWQEKKMTNAIVLSKMAHCLRLKSFHTSAALILTTLMLMVAAATPVATAQTYTDLYNFYLSRFSYATLAQGRDGNLYGTTALGGMNGDGVVFKITPSGKLKALYNFDGVHGSSPGSGMTLGTDGNLYGTAQSGGADGYGTIFKITPSGNLTSLYSFTGGTDGEYPEAFPIQGTDGNFYGATDNNAGPGTAYKISASGTFTLLASLPSGSLAQLLQATDGNFYGTTFAGGSSGQGTIFKMTLKGIVTVLYNFDGQHGEFPTAPLIQGSDGNFYGTASQGGSYGQGVTFELTLPNTITILHNFPDPNYPNDGYASNMGLVQATDGDFYGVTAVGGTMGYGVIFQITPTGGYSILYNFDKAHGAYPLGPMQHTNGEFYGVTFEGGTNNRGVVYSFDMGLGPFVSLVSISGKVGKTVEVLGQGFTGTTAISFNGTAATFRIVSDTYLTATVPTGATTGFVTVTTPSGTLTSNKQFRVTQ